MRTHGPRGTVHLPASREPPLWCAALTAVPPGASPFAAERVGEVLEARAELGIGTVAAGPHA